MTNANTQQFDSIGNNCGTLADHIRAAATLLEIDYTVGEVNIFGEVETELSISGNVYANRVKAASILNNALKNLLESK